KGLGSFGEEIFANAAINNQISGLEDTEFVRTRAPTETGELDVILRRKLSGEYIIISIKSTKSSNLIGDYLDSATEDAIKYKNSINELFSKGGKLQFTDGNGNPVIIGPGEIEGYWAVVVYFDIVSGTTVYYHKPVG
ncbi:MAG: hypothetical protein FGF50_09360, partial [Candidatus Brockarchaeota archaeon]|nr:hypothetical protein [Candidatus Brockarchaeota archaeon]